MKTQVNQKLNFTKNAIVELNDNDLYTINGGTTGFEVTPDTDPPKERPSGIMCRLTLGIAQ